LVSPFFVGHSVVRVGDSDVVTPHFNVEIVLIHQVKNGFGRGVTSKQLGVTGFVPRVFESIALTEPASSHAT
jgi:hypothetical protein